ncbi:MAG: hypothetical protein KCHDKBKB_01471 [Elusimicrobia bacterium]|nr:hypothetical protein [Elusimicrobiota bacterium]
MDVIPKRIEYYTTVEGKVPFREWYYSLKDIKTQAVVRERLTRVERGLLGDFKWVGEGVCELRISFGPGFRIYFGQEGRTVVWLLCGGEKNTQKRDIKTAHVYWGDYLRRKNQ